MILHAPCASHGFSECFVHATPHVGAATAAFPGLGHFQAMKRIAQGIEEPLLGALDPMNVQLCPQNRSVLGERDCTELRQAFPGVAMRPHANVACWGEFGLFDASSPWSDTAFSRWRRALRKVCDALGSPAYSWHAGRASQASLEQALAHTFELEQWLGIPVGIEGLYPSKHTPWLMSSFADYVAARDAGARFALDLSHWNIIATATRRTELALLKELLSDPLCIEVHLSTNDGRQDTHRKIQDKPFWFDAWSDLQAQGQIRACTFSEGIQERPALHTDFSRVERKLSPKNKNHST